MKISVSDIQLYIDIDGFGLVPDGPVMRTRPCVILVHGGPGFDHTIQKAFASQLAEFAQVICYDQRGHGRSDRSSPEHWTLAQWADDIVLLCEALGIEKPVVLGSSFGGIVVQEYAARHPAHAGKLILHCTTPHFNLARIAAKFETLAGPEARRVAEALWTDPGNPDLLGPYTEFCMPHYNVRRRDPAATSSWGIPTPDVLSHFYAFGQEGHNFDFRDSLKHVTCPTLVMGGEEDPICPIEDSEDIADALPEGLVRFRRFPACGHGLNWDDPEGFHRAVREFVLEG